MVQYRGLWDYVGYSCPPTPEPVRQRGPESFRSFAQSRRWRGPPGSSLPCLRRGAQEPSLYCSNAFRLFDYKCCWASKANLLAGTSKIAVPSTSGDLLGIEAFVSRAPQVPLVIMSEKDLVYRTTAASLFRHSDVAFTNLRTIL